VIWILSGLVCGIAAVWLLLRRRARFARLPAPVREREVRPCGTVRGVSFPAVDGTRLDGWLFLPQGRRPAPIAILAPGLGGAKDGFLEPFAWSFVERGVAALVFDYRCFGGSDGEPRHWVDPSRHREDYEAALAFVRGPLAAAGDVDPRRIGLWGSSFSGGTAIVTAARHPDTVRALVVQCPFLKTPPEIQPRGLRLLRLIFWATLDLLRVFPPIYVPIFGRPGEWVFAPSRENPSVSDFDGPLGAPFWRALPRPGLGGWENRMLARMLAAIDSFVPMDAVPELRCPVLFVAAARDDMVPLAYVEEAHARASSPAKQLGVFDCGHFDLYVGEPHAANAARQAEFLARHLTEDLAPSDTSSTGDRAPALDGALAPEAAVQGARISSM
jgi:pimeloyl-ACP methyl ester carboxylesterase